MTAWEANNRIVREADDRIWRNVDNIIQWQARVRRNMIFLDTKYRIRLVAYERVAQ